MKTFLEGCKSYMCKKNGLLTIRCSVDYSDRRKYETSSGLLQLLVLIAKATCLPGGILGTKENKSVVVVVWKMQRTRKNSRSNKTESPK